VGTPEEIADAVVMLMTNPFVTANSCMWMAARGSRSVRLPNQRVQPTKAAACDVGSQHT